MIFRLFRVGMLATLAALSLALVRPAAAQRAPAEPVAPYAAEVSEGHLRAFARAYLEVREIGEEHERVLSSVRSIAEAQALQQRAQETMDEAVRAEGLSPREYTTIVSLVNEDEALRLRFARILEDLTESAEPRERRPRAQGQEVP